MRHTTVAILLLAVVGAAVAQKTLLADTTASPTECKSSGANSCGNCAKGATKMYSETSGTTTTFTLELYCTSCSNGKTPDSSASSLTYKSTDSDAATKAANHNFNIGSKCFAAMKAFSFIAILAAALFQTA